MSTAIRLSRVLAVSTLALAATFAWAVPSPKDVEAAVQAGEFRQAESMLREVIREKPANARARYELGQVLAREGRAAEAREALLEAQRLDPSLKFATSPQRFQELLDKLAQASRVSSPGTGASAAPAASSASSAPMTLPRPAQPAPSSGGGFPWAYVVIAGVVGLLVWRLATRARPASQGAGLGMGAGSYGAYGAQAPQAGVNPYGAPAAGGSGLGGAVLGGLAGAAAGYGLAKVLEGHRDETSSGGGGDMRSSGGSQHDGGFIPIDNPPDYGAFDAGTGGNDSWDSGGASSDDSW